MFGLSANVQQAYINATGQLLAGAGNVTLDANGITVTPTTTINEIRAYKFSATSDFGMFAYADASTEQLLIRNRILSGTKNSQVLIGSIAPAGQTAQVQISASDNAAGAITILNLVGTGATLTGALGISLGLNVGTATGAGTGEISTSGTITTTNGTSAILNLTKTGASAGTQTIYNDGNLHIESGAGTPPIWIGGANAAPVLIAAGGGNVKIGGSASRATTEGAKYLDIFDGTAPVGTLANGISLYSTSGELRVMDAAGNATLLSPHDRNGYWIYDSVSPTGRRLRIDMERMVRAINEKFGWDFIKEYFEV